MGRCRERKLGEALKAANKLKAKKIITQIETRVAEMEHMLIEMKQSDPVVAAYYAGIAVDQLSGHPKQKSFSTLLKSITSDKAYATLRKATVNWYKSYPTYLDQKETVHLLPNTKKEVEAFLKIAPPESLSAQMADGILKLGK